ncbi:CP family cyanate transporter-like MFS transporter [Paenibacillus anaericanus]|uniref:CynX/NimT family MFS transporter n=1 Tax=Paenibacillus anaericanus TaxID=170367 RepID=UPI002786AE92|nr:MFS transporter [Paenibacillus anaericanus]MDQ0089939.1 CP family cyanate transporter-like MFS transporter [Paenibacillus anaericanus]
MNKDTAHSLSSPRGTSITLLVLAILLTSATLRAPITGVGSLIGQIQADTGLSHTMTGMLTTLPLIAFAIFALVAPKLSRRFGMEWTLIYCMVALTAGIAIRYFPNTLALFAGTALIGSAIAVCNVLIPGLIKREFPHKVGLMTSLYTSSMNMWAAIASGISIPLSNSFLGWRGSLSSWVILSIVTTLIWLPQLRRKPAKIGSNGSVTSRKSGSVWRSSVAWKVTIFMGLQSVMFYVGITWLPEILHEQGMSPGKAGWMLSLMQIMSMAGSFIMPLIASRMRSQKLLAASSAALFLIGFGGIWLGLPSFAPLFIMLIGLGCGTTFSLVILFFSLRTRTAEQAAELSGMAQSIGYLLASIGPTLFGFLHDRSGNWDTPLATMVFISLFAIAFGFLAGRKGYIHPE